MRAWAVGAAAVLVAAVVIAATKQSPHAQVEAKVLELAQAMARRDYARICRDVLAPPLATRLSLYGAPCPQTLSAALGDVHNPVVSVGKVIVSGRRASAVTLTVASGQQASLDTIELLDTPAGWRITSLASPVTRRSLGP